MKISGFTNKTFGNTPFCGLVEIARAPSPGTRALERRRLLDPIGHVIDTRMLLILSQIMCYKDTANNVLVINHSI